MQIFCTFVVVDKDFLKSIHMLVVVLIPDFNGQSAGPAHVLASAPLVPHNDGQVVKLLLLS